MSKLKPFIACGDNHGDLVCDEAIVKIKQFKAEWMPRGGHMVHVGDLWDMGSIRKGASDEERQRGMRDDFEQGLRFLDLGFNYLTLGNHDKRLWDNAEYNSNGTIREHCESLASDAEREFKKRKIKWIPYHIDKWIQLPEGGPKFLHGFVAGQYPATGMHQSYQSCIFGHVHAPSTFTAKGCDGGQSFSLPCMGDIQKMRYCETKPGRLKWRNGFGFGLINERTGKFNFWNVVKEDGIWITPFGEL